MTVKLESELLRTFLAVADSGNFTHAGEIVGRTQSAISLQIKRLEDGIGSALFDRGSRGVELTAQGHRLLINARRVVALLDETADLMRAPDLRGTVRIGIPIEYGNSILPKILGRFDMMHPDVEVTVQYGSSAVNVDALEKGELDLAVVFEPAQETQHERLMVDPTVWVTSALHDTHRRRPVPVAMYPSHRWCRDLAIASLERRSTEFRIAYLSDSSNGLAASVASGLAIAPLSRSSIPSDCRELSQEDGYDIIDVSNVVLRGSGRATDSVAKGMVNAIREGFKAFALSLD